MTECHRHLVLCTQTNPTGKQVAELGDLSAMYREECEHTHLVLGVTPYLTKPRRRGRGSVHGLGRGQH